MYTVLRTSRLVLRELSHDDDGFVAAMLEHPEVMQYYPQWIIQQGAAAWVDRQLDRYARFGHGLWLATERATGQPVGQIGLSIQAVAGIEEPEIGYLLHRPYWHRGFATEAARAVRDWALDDRGHPHVVALIRPINAPSQAVAKRIGMQPRPEMVQHAELEHLVFSITRDQRDRLPPPT